MRKVEYLTCLLAGVAVLFSFRGTAAPTPELPTVSLAVSDGVTLAETAHGGADYLGKIVFLGDSRTYGLRHFAMLEGGADTAAGLDTALRHHVGVGHAESEDLSAGHRRGNDLC